MKVSRTVISLFIVILVLSILTPIQLLLGQEEREWGEGISWMPMVPIKKVVFINYDSQSYLDDFAYLAAIPTSIFRDGQRLYSNPLLFYQPPQKRRELNSYQGIKYFMDDWLSYCGNLDEAVLVNVPEDESERIRLAWPAKKFTPINTQSPYEAAGRIALHDWSSCDQAVVAVIGDKFDREVKQSSGSINGIMPGEYKAQKVKFVGEKTPEITPTYHNFSIDEPYKYVIAYMTWNGFFKKGKDPDLQLYDWQLGEVAVSEKWNVREGADEQVESYVYHYGPWGAAVTYMPTEGISNQPLRGQPEAGSGLTARYTIDVTLYPGVEFALPRTPFMCRDITLDLEWEDKDQALGLIICGPSGAEIASSISRGKSPTHLHLDQLGEGRYTVTVVKLRDSPKSTNFKIGYKWAEARTRLEGDCIASAAEGSILASINNMPLLFAKKISLLPKAAIEALRKWGVDIPLLYINRLPKETIEVLKSLGVNKIWLIDLGSQASLGREFNRWEVERVEKYDQIYSLIMEETGQNDVVFSTLSPQRYLSGDARGQKYSEDKYGFYFAPAAYAAAHHGVPLLLVEEHPELSCSVAYHTENWGRTYSTREVPSAGCMTLTGKQVYDFLHKLGFDKPGMESMLTIAGQFEIGASWDRTFVGAAIPGRLIGTPIDVSYWFSRCVFYPEMIFANPALSSEPIPMINGSRSTRVGSSLKIKDPGGEVMVNYPVLQTWVTYEHRFNERASSYWGLNYTTRGSITPFWTKSANPIDLDVNTKYGQPGMYWPDMSPSEVVPFYLDKAGYASVFSTAFRHTMENLNRGCIMWFEGMHGGNRCHGVVGFWNDQGQLEGNPWRGYEWGGSTVEPDTMAMSKITGLDIVPTLKESDEHDGIVIAIWQQATQTSFVDGCAIDRYLENIHSCGIVCGSCLISNTYLHLALIRHGSVFQIIDPWSTSWYFGHGMNIFARQIALGDSVGQAYERAISDVGIGYLTDGWWWDILENLTYYGDPNLKVFSPAYSWGRPQPFVGGDIGGHTPLGEL